MFCLSFVLSYILIICCLISYYFNFHWVLGIHVAENIFMFILEVLTCFRLLKVSTLQHAMKYHGVQISRHSLGNQRAILYHHLKNKSGGRDLENTWVWNLVLPFTSFPTLRRLLSVSDNTHLVGRL